MRRLRDRDRLSELATGPLHHRAVHVLLASGPVRWRHKWDVYEAAASVAELAPALFGALLQSHHNVHGDLEPAAALILLDRLVLPPGTGHPGAPAELRAALAGGARDQHLGPGPGNRVSGGEGGARA